MNWDLASEPQYSWLKDDDGDMESHITELRMR